jgi:hypothetical protein
VISSSAISTLPRPVTPFNEGGWSIAYRRPGCGGDWLECDAGDQRRSRAK